MALDYGNYGIFLIMGNAGFVPGNVWEMTDFSDFSSGPGRWVRDDTCWTVATVARYEY